MLLIVAAGLLLGWFATAQFLNVDPQPEHNQPRPAGIELLFACLVIGLVLIGWLALLLAQWGLFSGPLLWLLLLILLVALALPKRSRQATRMALASLRNGSRPLLLESLILIAWLIVASWLFFRPHEYILGGADAGVYVSQAANITKTGSIVYDDPFLADLDPELRPRFLRAQPPGNGTEYYLFPAFNVADDQPGKIIPEFFPLHPVWQAVAFDLGGVWGALRLPGLWALLGSLALYLALRQVVGWPLALLGLAAMSLNALQVWFARYPVSETLTGFLLWSSLWALGAWLDRRGPGKLWAFVAALSLGSLFLVRIDTIFLLAIPIFIAAWLLLMRPKISRSELAWYFVPLALLVSHAILHALFVSTPYATRVLGHVQRTLSAIGLALPLFIGLFLLIALAIISYRFRDRLAAGLPGWWARIRRPALIGSSLVILLLTAYSWFLRPAWGAAGSYQDWWGGGAIFLYDHENLLRLGWYLSPVGVWLGAAGVTLLLWRGNRRTITILGVGLFFSLLYLWRIQINQHQIYAMRRYVPAVMPFFVFAAVFFLAWLLKNRRRWLQVAGIGLALLWLAGLAWSARGFVSQVDYRGLIREMAALDATLPASSILIFDDQSPVSAGDIVGMPLRYLYGHDILTYRLPDPAQDAETVAAIAAWQAAGRTVYWIGESAFLDANNLHYASHTFVLPTVFLEISYEHKPSQIIESGWTLQLHALDQVASP